MSACWNCHADPAVYTDIGTCMICGRPGSQPRPAPAKNGTWMEPNMWYGQREKLLPRIDQAIKTHQERKRNANR